LENISSWANTWQLKISNEKSKWLLISNKKREINPPDLVFQLAGEPLTRIFDVLDLGVNFSKTLNFTEHISITNLAFKTYIIPIPEYCSPVWNPQNVTDVKRLESVQGMFTKRSPGFEGLKYLDHLKKAEMCTLDLRRLHAVCRLMPVLQYFAL